MELYQLNIIRREKPKKSIQYLYFPMTKCPNFESETDKNK